MANIEREMEEALGLPPRAKYTSTAVQDTADLLDKEIAEAESAGISQEPPTASDIANTVIDFTPVIGDIKGGVEGAEVIFEELGKDDPNFLLIGVVGGAGVVGLIPGVGDAAQKLIMQGARRFKKTELNPELMEILTPKDQETVAVLTKNTLPTPETDGERLADEVATMLREGKAGDITDEMLETAGNDFHTRLTQNYIDGNVGMDLPMDWESTMARAADQGLTETRYHGSNVKDIPFFKGQGAKRQTGMFNTDDPFKAFSYEGKNGETYSLLMRPLPEDTPKVDVEGANWSNLDEPSMNYNKNNLSPDVRQGPRMDRQAQPLDEYLQEQTGNLTSDMFMRKASELGYPGATIENVVDRGPSTPTRFSKEEGIKARNLASQPSETQARTDTTGIRSVGARFDPRLTGLKNINMAQGGLTSMNDQTQRAFALGGEAETVDPVSGNDVPPGSLPEEVRDDIDAKLSEGEYVVPADVVRFFGVKFFEDLRTEAKMGLSNMEANGRIGGEPIGPSGMEENPLTPEEMAVLEQMGMAAGGFVPEQEPPQAIGNSVQGFAPGGDVQPVNNYQDGTAGLPSWASIPGASYMPQQWQQENLPSTTSYKPVQTITTADSAPATTTADTTTATAEVTSTTGKEACEKMGMVFDAETQQCILKQESSGSDDPAVTPDPGTEGFQWKEPDVDYFSMSDEDLAKVGLETSNKFETKVGKIGASLLAGPAGIAAFGLFDSARQGSTIAEVRSAALVAAAKGNTTLADTLNKRAEELVGKSSLLVQGADYFGALSGVNDFVQQIASFAPINLKINKELFGDNEVAYQRAVMASVTPKDEGLGKTEEERAAQKVLSNKNSFEELSKTDRSETWEGQTKEVGGVKVKQFQPAKTAAEIQKSKNDDKDSPEQAAAKSKAKAEAAASRLGVNLATGGRYKGGLMKKTKKK